MTDAFEPTGRMREQPDEDATSSGATDDIRVSGEDLTTPHDQPAEGGVEEAEEDDRPMDPGTGTPDVA